MLHSTDIDLVTMLRSVVQPLTGSSRDLDPIMELVGDARFVLIGEATHGTHDFYQTRAQITQRLIQEKGFAAVAIEGDWPDAYRVNRFARGLNDDRAPEESLNGFERFPTWMWRNRDVVDFIAWLRQWNQGKALDQQTGFYGLDLYSLYRSLEAVIGYLDQIDPAASARARQRYACFEPFGQDSQNYAFAVNYGQEACEDDVIAQLVDLQQHATEYTRMDGQLAEDEYFFAVQNAKVARDSENYYRTMFRGGVSSWNVRDAHMADTLDALAEHFDRHGGRHKIAVWAHNSHVGDARATEVGQQGEFNIGQLARQRHSGETILIGFATYAGTVIAADDWDMPALRKRVRPGLSGSYETLFHTVGIPRFLLSLRAENDAVARLHAPLLQRAIGVIYRPDTERWSHYYHTRLADQFDALVHIDETSALEPLEVVAEEFSAEAPETYPSTL